MAQSGKEAGRVAVFKRVQMLRVLCRAETHRHLVAGRAQPGGGWGGPRLGGRCPRGWFSGCSSGWACGSRPAAAVAERERRQPIRTAHSWQRPGSRGTRYEAVFVFTVEGFWNLQLLSLSLFVLGDIV